MQIITESENKRTRITNWRKELITLDKDYFSGIFKLNKNSTDLIKEVILELREVVNKEKEKEEEDKIYIFSKIKKLEEVKELDSIVEYLERKSKYYKDLKNQRSWVADNTKALNIEVKMAIRGYQEEEYNFKECLLEIKNLITELIDDNKDKIYKKSKNNYIYIKKEDKKINKILCLCQFTEILKFSMNQMITNFFTSGLIKKDVRKKSLENILKNIKTEFYTNSNQKIKKFRNKEEVYNYFYEFFFFFKKSYKDLRIKKIQEEMINKKEDENYPISLDEMYRNFEDSITKKRTQNQKKKIITKEDKSVYKFKERLKIIEETTELLNKICNRNLSVKNLRNLRAIYFEVYKNKEKFRTRRTARQMLLNCYKNNQENNRKYEELLKKSKDGSLEKEGFVKIGDSFFRMPTSPCKIYKEKTQELSEDEITFISEKITRGIFYAEGLTNEEYKLLKQIEWELNKKINIVEHIIDMSEKFVYIEQLTLNISNILLEEARNIGIEYSANRPTGINFNYSANNKLKNLSYHI